jgi:hypothetical protein
MRQPRLRSSNSRRTHADGLPVADHARIHSLLSGGDRRSIADSNLARHFVEEDPSRVAILAALADDENWLIVQRALDLLEKLAHVHPGWVAPHKKLFIGTLAESDKWEIRLQIVRALPLFSWSPPQKKRVEKILIGNLSFPQTFVRAWALDSLVTFSTRNPALRPIVEHHLREFERSPRKSLKARARQIRARLERQDVIGRRRRARRAE